MRRRLQTFGGFVQIRFAVQQRSRLPRELTVIIMDPARERLEIRAARFARIDPALAARVRDDAAVGARAVGAHHQVRAAPRNVAAATEHQKAKTGSVARALQSANNSDSARRTAGIA